MPMCERCVETACHKGGTRERYADRRKPPLTSLLPGPGFWHKLNRTQLSDQAMHDELHHQRRQHEESSGHISSSSAAPMDKYCWSIGTIVEDPTIKDRKALYRTMQLCLLGSGGQDVPYYLRRNSETATVPYRTSTCFMSTCSVPTARATISNPSPSSVNTLHGSCHIEAKQFLETSYDAERLLEAMIPTKAAV